MSAATAVSNILSSDWLDRINAAYSKSLEAIIETGRLLLEFKKSAGHGCFMQCFDEGRMLFPIDTAEKVMRIASSRVLSNSANLRNLPQAISSLYLLSQMPEEQLQQAISDGAVHPDMRARDIKMLIEARSSAKNLRTKARGSLLSRHLRVKSKK
jgi:hypothetical protein